MARFATYSDAQLDAVIRGGGFAAARAAEDELFDRQGAAAWEPTCSLCDGVGHGYPGAGPCPLEETGEDDPRERELWAMEDARVAA
jgi:hypothetical protein